MVVMQVLFFKFFRPLGGFEFHTAHQVLQRGILLLIEERGKGMTHPFHLTTFWFGKFSYFVLPSLIVMYLLFHSKDRMASPSTPL